MEMQKNEEMRAKLENVVASILREILEAKEANEATRLKLNTALGSLGFVIPDTFNWSVLWDEMYVCEDKGLAKDDNIFSYYFSNRKSIRHIPEWLRYKGMDDISISTSLLPSKELAAQWFTYVVDYTDIAEKLAFALRNRDRTEDLLTFIDTNLGVELVFDFKVSKEKVSERHDNLVRTATISSLIIPTSITASLEEPNTSQDDAMFLSGVLKGYFGYIAGVYK